MYKRAHLFEAMLHQVVTMSIKKWCLIALTVLTTHTANCQKIPNFECTGDDTLSEVTKLIPNFGTHRDNHSCITLRLHTRTHFEGPSEINVEDEVTNLQKYGFDPRVKTIVIIHGYEADGKEDWLQKMKNAFLTYRKVNVLIVDWGLFAKEFDYHDVAAKTVVVASQVADFLMKIRRKYSSKNKWGRLYLIGHSLGAHVAGMTARNLRTRGSKWKVERITGLDPAFPCFNNNSLALSKSDALYVDIIHTTGSSGYGPALGTICAIGHVDIYMNGAAIQLPCIKSSSSFLRFFQKPEELTCSHGESHEYFTESVNVAAGQIPDGQYIDATMWNRTYADAEAIVNSGGCNHISQCKDVGIHSNERGDDGVYFAITASRAPFYSYRCRSKNCPGRVKINT